MSLTLGRLVRHYRVRAKLSQKDLEAVTGIPQTTISDWENDKYEPVISDLKKLSIALKITIAELLNDETCATIERQAG